MSTTLRSSFIRAVSVTAAGILAVAASRDTLAQAAGLIAVQNGIEAGMVNRSIESAQRKVEARNFDIRKQLLEYDDVSNDQRKVIYQQRNDILDARELHDQIAGLRHACFTDLVRQFVPAESVEEQWDIEGLEKTLLAELQLGLPIKQWLANESDLDEDRLRSRIVEHANRKYLENLTFFRT